MKDLNKIQEFFSKSLEEGKQLDIEDFAKVVQAVTKTGHPVTVLFVPKWNEIEVLTGMNAPDDMIRDLFNAVNSLGYGRNDIIIAGDSSNLSRREYSDIRRVNGGHKDYFEESINEAKEELPKKTFLSIFKDIKNLALKMAKDNAKEASQYIKPGKAADTNPMADIAKVQQDLMSQAQLDEGIKDAINNITKFSGAGSLLTGGGYLLSYIDQLELKYYQWYYSAIKNMADFEIFELLKNKYGIEEQISAWEQKVIMYAFFVFFTIFVVAIGAKLVSKASNKFVKEATKEEEDEFHKDLDKLVHKTFGHSSDEKKKMKEAKIRKAHGQKISKELFAKLKGKVINYKGEEYKVVDADEAVIKLTPVEPGGRGKTINLNQFNVGGIVYEVLETIKLGQQLNEELCEKGKRYIKARQAAGEKSSAYLSGRAVRVCKGQIEWPKKGKK